MIKLFLILDHYKKTSFITPLLFIITIFSNVQAIAGNDCKAIIKGDIYGCVSKDCKAIINEDVYGCASKDCKAMIKGDVYGCN